MIRLRIKARFAAFRNMTAGSFRPSTPFLTPAAAYGLLLNLAGIDSRFDDGKSLMTLTRNDLPSFEIVIGTRSLPEDQTLFQQLHNYPVGASGKDRQEECKGAKYNIQPIRREFLSDIDASILIRADNSFIEAVRQGLKYGVEGILSDGRNRYGIPFLGDNNFMIDILEEEKFPPNPVLWFYPIVLQSVEALNLPQLYRMPIWIDRAEMSNTITALFALTVKGEETIEPREDAWIQVGPVAKELV